MSGYLLSPQQKRLLNLNHNASVGSSRIWVNVSGQLDKPLLLDAIGFVHKRFDILRTAYHKRATDQSYTPGIVDKPATILQSDMRRADVHTRDAGLKAMFARDNDSAGEEGSPVVYNLVQCGETEHTLFITASSLSMDNRAMKIIADEIIARYQGAQKSEVQLQYSHYAQWQNENLEGLAKEVSFWDEYDYSAYRNFQICYEREHSAVNAARYQRHREVISGETLVRLNEVLAERGIALENFLLGCWSVLLSQLSDKCDVIVGYFEGGRNHSLLTDAPGLMKRVLPVVLQVDARASFLQLLESVHNGIDAVTKWSDYFILKTPYANETFPEYIPYCYEFDDLALDSGNSRLQFSVQQHQSFCDQFKIRLSAARYNDSVVLDLHFSDHFRMQDVVRLHQYLLSIIGNAVDQPEGAVGALFVGVEAGFAADAHTNGNATLMLEGTVHNLFHRQAEKTPDQIAVAYRDRYLSYRELDLQSDQVSSFLRYTMGLNAGELVAIISNEAESIVIGALGILKSGAAYIPIDASLPEKRISQIIADSGARLALTQRDVTLDGVRLFSLNDCLSVETKRAVEQVHDNDRDLCYVIYTSGSTGTPKGVMIEHRSVVNQICALEDVRLQKDPLGRFGLTASFTFDASIQQLLGSLLLGRAVHIIDQELKKNLVSFIHHLKRSKISSVDLTPSLLSLLIEEHEADFRECGVQEFLVGGESWSPKLIRNFYKTGLQKAGMKFINVYGPTECCVNATSFRIPENRELASIPIGKPLRNYRIYILNEFMKAVPPGVIGEIYIGGVGVARGYLKNERLTSEAFVSDLQGEGMMYKTGDKGRMNEEGDVEFIGRGDTQIKVSGHRIELKEIESALRLHPGVDDVYLFVSENNGKGKSIKAVLTPDARNSFPVKNILKAKRENGKFLDRLYALPNGMSVYQMNKNETDLVFYEIFTDQTYMKGNITINPGDTVFDVGANIGMFSLYTGLNFSNVEIFAFEPVEQVYDILRLNMRLYGVRAQTFNYGLSDKEQTVEFSYYPNTTVLSGRYGNEREERDIVKQYLANQYYQDGHTSSAQQVEELLEERIHSENIKCQMRRLSDVIEEEKITQIDLLKIDVEKSEIDVLKGIDDAHWPRIRQVVIEVHDQNDEVRFIEDLLTKQGFTVEVGQDAILAETNIFNIYARRGESGKGLPAHDRLRFDDGTRWAIPDALLKSVREGSAALLPEYMLPSQYILLDRMPLNASGKIDLNALTVLEESVNKTNEVEEPEDELTTDVEKLLAELWRSVLGRTKITGKDNFFEVGGDSIRAIQIASRMYKAGYKLEVKDIFQNPVIKQLATKVKVMKTAIDQSAVKGIVPLTAIQKEFFLSPPGNLHHFNQSVMLFSSSGFDSKGLRAVFNKILAHHDALRMQYRKGPNHVWEQFNAETSFNISIKEHDLRSDKNAQQTLSALCDKLQRSLELTSGTLLQVGLFHLNDGDRLLIVIHHLVVDGISWRILFEDLGSLYAQHTEGKTLALPPKSDSFKKWSEFIQSYAASADFLQEKQYWQSVEAEDISKLKKDKAGSNRVKDRRSKQFNLSAEQTELLLTRVPRAFTTEINDVLLTGLGLALKDVFGNDKFLIELEGHGREQLADNLDISRTVGWFTSAYPVVIDLNHAGNLPRQIKEVKEYLRKIPNKGIGYGILKYITPPELKNDISFRHEPEISFNYLGQFDSDVVKTNFGLAKESPGWQESENNERRNALEVNGIISGGRLQLTISYSHEQFTESTINRLIAAYEYFLDGVIQFCSAKKNREITPDDLTVKTISIDQLEELLKLYPALEDVYPLSPMQEGLLFHALYDVHSDAYFQQVSYRLEGDLDLQVVERSLRELALRHSILRTAFLHQHVERPLQVVLRDRQVEFHYKDIRGEQDPFSYMHSYKADDKSRSFDLERDPLMRISIFRFGKDAYEFIWSFHHILMDGWCVGILTEEYFQMYRAFQADVLPRLQAPIPYGKYISWIQGRDMELSRQYWRKYTGGIEKLCSFPKASAAGKDPQAYQLARKVFNITEADTSRLQAMAAKNQVTLNSLLQSVWALLLSKYNDTPDVVFGSVVSGRPSELEGVERMVGLFINTIPVRVAVNPHDTFSSMLSAVQQAAVESEAYHHYPLAEIQSISGLNGALFDHILVFENFPLSKRIEGIVENGSAEEDFSLKGTSIEVFEQTNYDLNVIIIPGTALTVSISFNANVYKSSTIDSIIRHFMHLTDQVAANENMFLRDLELVDAAERDQILRSFNPPLLPYDRDMVLHGLFEAEVKRSPHKIAVLHQDKTITYEELHRRSNQLGHFLRSSHGIQANDLVGIMVERSEWMLIAILGVLKSGAAYVPIDPGYPEERVRYIVKDSQVKVVLTRKEFKAYVDGGLAEVVTLDKAFTDRLASMPASDLPWVNSASDISYIIYTSGSTGQPKGIRILHRNVVSFLNWSLEEFRSSVFDILLSGTSYCFDLSVYEFFYPLMTGRQVRILESGLELASYLPLSKRVLVNTVPSVVESLLREGVDLGSVNVLNMAGEPVSVYIRESVDYHRIAVRNLYGPSETTTYSSVYHFSDDHPIIPIGRPAGNSQIYILDTSGRLLPAGVEGELYIGGDGVSGGYLGRADLTSRVFVENPYGAGQLYKTGDMGRWLADGMVEFLGRRDHQVKLRGYRIELGEIEQVLSGYTGVEKVLVDARGEGGSKHLVAYYTGDVDIKGSALQSYMQERLPGYMVPSSFVRLEQFPLTPNGKIDRKSLPSPSEEVVSGKVEGARTPMEASLLKIYAQVLKRGSVGLDDNFFALGGQSIKAIQIISRVSKEFGLKLELKDLFAHPTVRGISGVLSEARKNNYEEITPIAAQAYYDLSNAQKRLWILHQMAENLTAFNINSACIIKGDLQFTYLERALRTLIERHESLRTVFFTVNGEPKQKVIGYDELGFGIEYVDLRGRPDQDVTATRLINEKKKKPFDLRKGPLVGVMLIHLEEDKYIISIAVHHIVVDGWSMDILIREVMVLYAAYLEEKTNPLPPLSIQYRDYAAWHNRQIENEKVLESSAFWRQMLKDASPILELPTVYKRPLRQTFNGNALNFSFSTTVVSNLKKLSRENNCTLFMTLVSALNVLLYKYTSEKDIVLGTDSAGRGNNDLENSIGLFLNTLVLRTRITEKETFTELLSSVRDMMIRTYEHQTYAFEDLHEFMKIRKDQSYLTVCNVFVVMQNYFDRLISDKLEIENEDIRLSAEFFKVENPTSIADLEFAFTENNDNLNLHIRYNTDLFNDDYINRIFVHFLNIINGILGDPKAPVSALQLTSEEERLHLLHGFNKGSVAFHAPGVTFIELFEKNAADTPDAIAVVHEDKFFSYDFINRASGNLAHYLRNSISVRPDDLVGVAMERSEAHLIAILGILRSSGGFLPLDPEYPEGKVAAILEDAAPRVVIDDESWPYRNSASTAGIKFINIRDFLNIDTQPHSLERLHAEESISYVIYTSGSTGTPKGTIIEHKGMLNHISSKISDLKITGDTRIAQTASACFDISVWQFFTPLAVGGTTFIFGKKFILAPQKLAKRIYLEKIHFMEVIPSYLSILLNDIPETKTLLQNVQTLIVTGDVLKAGLVQQWFDVFPGKQLVNAYGPTEASDDITHHIMNDFRGWENIPLGKPLPNLRIYILDEFLNLCPVGLKGEIYVAGVGVGRGYLNRPEQTIDAFGMDPFVNGAGQQRIYRTGDLGKWNHEGEIEFLGRRDDQLKISGYRVEMQQIENVLLERDEISEVVIIPKEGRSGEKYLVAYFTTHKRFSTDALRRYLREQLPFYMIPAYLMRLEHFPRTTSGKVDRTMLPAPEHNRSDRPAFASPESKTEWMLLKIWQELFEREDIGVLDNFFEMGGHSLKAIRLIGSITKGFGIELELRDVFNNPTIRQMAVMLLERESNHAADIEVMSDQQHYEVSHGQKNLYLGYWYAKKRVPYNMMFSYVLEKINRQALEQAFKSLVERHESLRTTISLVNGELRQRIRRYEDLALAIEYVDVRDFSDKDAAVRVQVNQRRNHIFNKEQGPLLTASLYQLEDHKYFFTLVVDHIVFDALSLSVVEKELLMYYDFYNGVSTVADLSILKVQYKEYASWQSRMLRSHNGDDHAGYWTRVFERPLEALLLPYDRPKHQERSYRKALRRDITEYFHNMTAKETESLYGVLYSARPLEGDSYQVFIENALYQKLIAISVKAQCSLFSVLLASVNGFLYTETGQRDIVVGSPVSLRKQASLENVVGYFLDILLTRNEIEEETSFESLVRQVSGNVLEGLEHREYPFEKVLADADLSFDIVGRVAVHLMNFEASMREELTSFEPSHRSGSSPIFDLNFTFQEYRNGVSLICDYRSELFDPITIEGILIRYISFLHTIADDTTKRISRDTSPVSYSSR